MAEAVGSLVRVDIGQERNIAGIFDRSGEIPLLFGGEVRDPAGQDFAALGDEFTQEFGVFVIDGITGFDGREAFAEITHGLNCSVRESKEFKGAIAPSKAKKKLFGFFMHRMLIAVGAEFFDFHPAGGVPAVFHRGIAGNAGRALIGVCAALGTFQSDDDSNAFLACHSGEVAPPS